VASSTNTRRPHSTRPIFGTHSRYAQEYALANKVDHPRSVYLRERDLLEPLDAALATAFAPHRLTETITAMVDHQDDGDADDQEIVQARARLAECNTKLARHRAALEAGADPVIVTAWIAEVEADRRRLLSILDRPGPQPAVRMSREQITTLVAQLGDIVACCAKPTRRTGRGLPATRTPTDLPPARAKKSASRLSLARTHMGNWFVSEGT
jgi:site-specific DNA recombinase